MRVIPSFSMAQDFSGSKSGLYSGMTAAITAPLSVQEPKLYDQELTKKMEEALEPHGVFESEVELNHRYVFILFLILL